MWSVLAIPSRRSRTARFCDTAISGKFLKPSGLDGQLHPNLERHLDLCEARAVLRWPIEKRQKYLIEREAEMGSAYVEKLKQDMTEQHRIRATWQTTQTAQQNSK